MTELALLIGSRRLEGWTAATVTRSLETIAGKFSLEMSERAPGETAPRPIVPGMSCRIELDGDLVLTGYVDDVAVKYSDRSHTVGAAGRDVTGDLVDCSAEGDPGEWHNERLENIAATLCRPFGIPVKATVDTGEPFARFRIEEGESVFEALDRACRFRGVLPVSDGKGALMLSRPQRGRSETPLVYGGNLLQGSASLSWKDRYSNYTLLGQQPGSDFLNPEGSSQVLAGAEDPGIGRYRPLTVIGEQALNDAEAEERIVWESNVRASRGRTVNVLVQGWRERPDGPLWAPGRLVPIQDPLLGLDRVMLIGATKHTKSEGGTTTALTLYPRDAFERRIEPEPDPTGFFA